MAPVDPVRLATAALERIKTVLVRRGRVHTFGQPITMRDLADRVNLMGDLVLPPSYATILKLSATLGEPEVLLRAPEMERAIVEHLEGDPDRPGRYVPFAIDESGKLVCFDREMVRHDDEMHVVVKDGRHFRTEAKHFGEWLDKVADAREEDLENATEVPKSLKDLLLHLGFRFADPIVGVVETGDVAAIEALLGPAATRAVRGEVDRLFDSTGKTTLTLTLDDFTLTMNLRSGPMTFEADDVFRWLRTFRDENFFGETVREPSHPDQTRDLRTAAREPPLVVRGVLELPVLAARKHRFFAASGASVFDFHVLGRPKSAESSASLLLHVVRGEVKDARKLTEAFDAVYLGLDGSVWCLANRGTVLRIFEDTIRTFHLPRLSGSLTYWHGIGGSTEHVLVWGTGALLRFDGEGFSPFVPDAGLERHEVVTALTSHKRNVAMLVSGEHVGAVARFDGRGWLPIHENQVIEGDLVDFDVFRGTGLVLARNGVVHRIEHGKPTPYPLDRAAPAFRGKDGARRQTLSIRSTEGAVLVGCEGGVIVLGSGPPVFHAAPGTEGAVQLVRVGSDVRPADDDGDARTDAAIVALAGPNVLLWRGGGFQPLDLRAW